MVMRAFGGAVGYPMYPTRKALPGVFTPNDHWQMVQEDRAPTVQDPYFSNVKCLIHGNAVLNAGMPLDVTGNYTVPWYASAAQQFSGRSIATPFPFVGTSFSNASTDGGIHAQWIAAPAIGTADFTLEIRYQPFSTASALNLIDMRPGANGFYPTIDISATGKVLYFTNNITRITGTTSLLPGRDYFIAYTRASGTGTLWFGQGGGTASSEGTWADTSTYAATGDIFIAGSFFRSGPPAGSAWDEIRLTVGTARYSSSFPVPTDRFPDY